MTKQETIATMDQIRGWRELGIAFLPMPDAVTSHAKKIALFYLLFDFRPATPAEHLICPSILRRRIPVVEVKYILYLAFIISAVLADAAFNGDCFRLFSYPVFFHFLSVGFKTLFTSCSTCPACLYSAVATKSAVSSLFTFCILQFSVARFAVRNGLTATVPTKFRSELSFTATRTPLEVVVISF